MSRPVSACAIHKAAIHGGEFEFVLTSVMISNLNRGSMLIHPCKCDPPCVVASEDQLDQLEQRIQAAYQAQKKGRKR